MDERRLACARDDGASVLEQPVVGEDDVQKRAGALGGNPGVLSIARRTR